MIFYIKSASIAKMRPTRLYCCLFSFAYYLFKVNAVGDWAVVVDGFIDAFTDEICGGGGCFFKALSKHYLREAYRGENVAGAVEALLVSLVEM